MIPSFLKSQIQILSLITPSIDCWHLTFFVKTVQKWGGKIKFNFTVQVLDRKFLEVKLKTHRSPVSVPVSNWGTRVRFRKRGVTRHPPPLFYRLKMNENAIFEKGDTCHPLFLKGPPSWSSIIKPTTCRRCNPEDGIWNFLQVTGWLFEPPPHLFGIPPDFRRLLTPLFYSLNAH